MQPENVLLDKYIISSDCSKLLKADLGTLCLLATVSQCERVGSWSGHMKRP